VLPGNGRLGEKSPQDEIAKIAIIAEIHGTPGQVAKLKGKSDNKAF
jgi:hypothetical protein